MHDLVVRGGAIADGTGGPLREGDVAIDDGVISAVGDVAAKGRQEIDASDRVVTPGFVDVHTHYDGQVTWDPLLTPSIWHGVSTVVMGNCGVGFAPAQPDRHDWLIGLMEGVEDVPGVSLREAIRWDWVSFPEYLDALDRLPLSLDVAAQVPHGAVRAYVMGERGAANEPATADDIQAMAAEVRAGVAAGAVGLSVNRLEMHRAVDGREVPGTFASDDELFALASALRDGDPSGEAVFSIIFPSAAGSDGAAHAEEIDRVASISREFGIRVTFPFGASSDGSDRWRTSLARIEDANALGARLVPQVGCRRQGLLCGLRTRHPFAGRPSYREIRKEPITTQARLMSDPELKQRILGEESDPRMGFLLELMVGQPDGVFRFADADNYEPSVAASLGAEMERSGRDAAEIIYDWTIGGNGDDLVMFVLGGYPGSLDSSLELMSRPDTVLGLGDGGAHVSVICDAGYPTHVLSHWVRDRDGDRLSLESAIEILTRKPARLFGMHDRGVLAPGMRADVNVLDPDQIAARNVEVVRDLPGGAKRIIQRADGYQATVVAGEVVLRDGEDTGRRPGRAVRRRHRAA